MDKVKKITATAELENPQPNIDELQRFYERQKELERLRPHFALKWVERVVFWAIVAVATAMVGKLIAVYLVQPIIPK